MKQLVLNIEESKFKAFLSYIKTLDYVSVLKEPIVPEWQMKEVSKRINDVENGRMSVRDWDDARDDLMKR